MKQITLTYEDGTWTASADPPVNSNDQIILFSNASDRSCQVTFKEPAAFGIKGICLAPDSAFTLVYRGVTTKFQLDDSAIRTINDNPTIPPGSRL